MKRSTSKPLSGASRVADALPEAPRRRGRLLILVRHSEVAIDPELPSASWVLSRRGRRKARELAEQLERYDPTAIVGSREPKASQTAALMARHLDRPTDVVAGLEENHRGDLPFFETEAEYRTAISDYFQAPNDRRIGKETPVQACERFSRAIEEVLASYPTGNLVVVTHGVVLTLFVQRHNQHIDPYDFWKELRMPDARILQAPRMTLLPSDDLGLRRRL